MGLLLPLYWVVAAVSFVACMVTNLQLAEFLSRHTPLTSNATLLAGGVTVGCSGPFFAPFFWDGFLLLLFIVQHSGMKTRFWKGFVSEIGLSVVERALYTIATAVTLQFVMEHWEDVPGLSLWWVDTRKRSALWLFFVITHVICWVAIYAANLCMDLPELIGVRQVYYYTIGVEEPMTYKSRGAQSVYAHMRHAGALCLLLVLWLHPVMTLARLLLAVTWTLYILLASRLHAGDHAYLRAQLGRKTEGIAMRLELAQ